MATEFCDVLCARYNITPLKIQSNCDRCGTAFDVCHTLSCSKGGLVIKRHNKVHDELLDLARRDFTSASVHVEPLIHQGRNISEREIRQGGDKDKETQGYVMIQFLWDQQTESIIDIKLGDTDVDSYKYEQMAALLDWWETIKEDKHSKNYHDQRTHFSLFVLSVNSMLGREALFLLS